jgi:Holliday junction resolvase RusA-like endonuclease
MRSWDFTFYVSPVAKGRPVFSGKSNTAYTPLATRHAEAELRWLIRKEFKEAPLTGALMINASFFFQRPKSVSAKTRPHHTVRPDIDNILKLLKDAGNGLLWQDDAQITVLMASKHYAETPSINLKIQEL